MIDPLLTLGVYVFLVQVMFDRGGPQYPLMVFICILSWKWFSTSTQTALHSIYSKRGLVLRIKFPLAILPLSCVLAAGIKFLMALVVFFFLAISLYKITPSLNYIWLPVLLMIQLILTAAAALFVSVAGVFFKDLGHILQFALRLGFYLSPSLYGIEMIPASLLPYYALNPFTGLMASYKNILIYNESPVFLVESLLTSLVLFLCSWLFFINTSVAVTKEI
jgi:ABC-type polysaccharide/polyol phosphate export permease